VREENNKEVLDLNKLNELELDQLDNLLDDSKESLNTK